MAGFIADEHDEVMSEINMVPFIDVMLVLLIVFIITVPVMKHAVNVELPRADHEQEQEQIKPETLNLTVQADGSYVLGDAPIADEQLGPRLQAEAAKQPPPELHIRGHRDVRYERVVQAMAAAQQASLSKIGFVTEPPRQGR